MGGHRHKVVQAQLTAIASEVWQELVEVVGSTSIVFGFTPSRPGRKPRAKEEASLKACREILGDNDSLAAAIHGPCHCMQCLVDGRLGVLASRLDRN
jgi:hypothetical protein